MASRPPSLALALAVVRGAYGAGLLLAPPPVLARLARTPLDGLALVAARTLGARELAQAAAIDARPTRARLALGVAVDCAHAASMVAVARWARRADHRSLAAGNARSAAALAALGGVSLAL